MASSNIDTKFQTAHLMLRWKIINMICLDPTHKNGNMRWNEDSYSTGKNYISPTDVRVPYFCDRTEPVLLPYLDKNYFNL